MLEIGAVVHNFVGFRETGRSARACVDLALHAEGAGFASVWVTDHVVLPERRAAQYPHGGDFAFQWYHDIHDPLALMAALAQATERVAIGAAVLVIPYRHPLLTAKMLATIDQLSEGRVVLGAGVGWLHDEFAALGLDPEVFEHRGTVTEDFLRAMRTAWTAPGPATHRGPWVDFEAVGTRPQPFRAGHLPVWIGGKGDRALRRAVRLGDGYLAISSSPDVLRQEVARLHALAEEAGRDPGELTVALIEAISVAERPAGGDRRLLQGSSEQITQDLHELADAGLEHLVSAVQSEGDHTYVGACRALDAVAAEVLPHL